MLRRRRVKITNKISRTRLSKRVRIFGLSIFLFWSAVFSLLASTQIGKQLEYQVAHRVEFYVRHLLKQSPSIDPRIKIFGYDDQAVAAFARPEMTLRDWSVLIQTIAEQQPKVIIIDQMFGFWPVGSQADREHFKRVLANYPIVAVGSFVYPFSIPSRDLLRLDRDEFKLEQLVDQDFKIPEWLSVKPLNVYGAQREVQEHVASIGHIIYPGEGRISPLIRVERNTVIPHLAFAASNKISIKENALYNNGRIIPTDDLGQIRINFSSVEDYFKATRSLKTTLKMAHDKAVIKSVMPGDIVLIIPELYTGNHDVLDTPVGRIPGGFVIAAVINSVMTGGWLQPVGNYWALNVAVVALSIIIGLLSGPVAFWPFFIGFLLVLIATPVLLFSYVNIAMPWFFLALGAIFSALSAYAGRTSWWMLENIRLRNALRGTIPEPKIQAILNGEGQLQHEASEQTVTLLFLDIANFSIVAEQSTPKDIFLDLKHLMRDVTKIVHEYGGTIDKTLGDGMLAFFGYSYDGETSDNQADQAIKCAIELQKYNLRRCFEAASIGRSVLPFRIGINTAPVFIGDIGNEERIDFTVIGSGVNQAQRLESACEQHMIMVSTSAMNHAKFFHQAMPGFTKRYIAVKHHHDLLEVIEYDPFHDDYKLRSLAIREFRKSFKLERRELRWAVHDPSPLSVSTNFGPGTLLDFSESGLCLKIDRYLSKGVIFELNLRSFDQEVSAMLEQKGLAKLKAEVRWGRSLEQGYSHGLRLINLSEAQLAVLFSIMSGLFGKSSASMSA